MRIRVISTLKNINVGSGLVLLMSLVLLSGCFENPEKAQLTTTLTYVESTRSVTIKGTIVSDGESEIFQKGICMGTHANPTIEDGPSNSGSGNENFEMTIGLSAGTYYFRSYATNGAGTAYGNEVVFSIMGVSLVDLFLESGTTAFVRGNVISDSPVLSRGVCWSTTTDPTINDSKTNEGTETGIFTSQITGLSPGTTYYVRTYAVNSNGVFYSEAFYITTEAIPTLITKNILNAGTFLITSGGTFVDQWGSLAQHVGICWSTTHAPTIADNTTDDYLNLNDFNSAPSGLQPGVTYYIRAYATNSSGTGYGNEQVITMPEAAVVDIDGNPYSSTTIGSQVWLVENLKTTRFSNGDPITEVSNDGDLRATTSPDWMYYGYSDIFNFPYGKLYNWYTVADARNVCPSGWHVSTDDEWLTMIDSEGGFNFAVAKILESGTFHWQTFNSSDNSSGLTILPGGGQAAGFYSYSLPSQALFWTSTSADTDNAWAFNVSNANNAIYHPGETKKSGLSVRCVKD